MDINSTNQMWIPWLGWLLTIIWLGLAKIKSKRNVSIYIGIVLIFSLLPIFPYRLPTYLLGILGNLSIVSIFLICLIFWESFQKVYINQPAKTLQYKRPNNSLDANINYLPKYWLLIFTFIVLAVEISAITAKAISLVNNLDLGVAVVLDFPDVYRWGFVNQLLPDKPWISGKEILIISQLIALILFWQKSYKIALALTVAVVLAIIGIFGKMNFYVGVNVWDYLVDGWVIIFTTWGLFKTTPRIKRK